MFDLTHLFRSSDSDSPLPTLSIIGDDTPIRGDTITGSGDLRIEGNVRADIRRDGRVVVAPDGAVHGTVRAESIQVADTVRGELHAEDTPVLGAASDAEVRHQADAFTIESGADFKGLVHGEGDSSLERVFPSGDQLPAPVDIVDAGAETSGEESFVPVWEEGD